MKYSTMRCPYCGNTVQFKIGSFDRVARSPFQTCMKCGREFVNSNCYEAALYPFSKYIPSNGDLFFEKFGNIHIGLAFMTIITAIVALCGGLSWEAPGILFGITVIISIPFGIVGYNNMKKGVTNERFKKITADYLASTIRLSDTSYASKMSRHSFIVPSKFFEETPHDLLINTLDEIWSYDKHKLEWYSQAISEEIPALATMIQMYIQEKTRPAELIREERKVLIDQTQWTETQPKLKEDQPRGNDNYIERNNNRLFCRRCGKELMLDSEFCSYCGTKIVRIDK